VQIQRKGSVSDKLGRLTFRSLTADLTERLTLAGVSNSRRTAHDVITTLLDVPRSWGVGHRDAAIDEATATRADAAVDMIVAGAPFAYAVERAHFRHLVLTVDERVLIPRPETEVLVEIILRYFRRNLRDASDWGVAVDIGTGSGNIALSLAMEGKFGRIIATDASLDALEVARANYRALESRLKAPVEMRSGSLLSAVRDVRPSLIVSNPPYISFDESAALPSSVRDWEPPTALFSGSNGLAATAAIVQEGMGLLRNRGMLALEVDTRRASLVAEMVMSAGGYSDVSIELDLTGRERFVIASRT
jgi:release factor glutamine methyltransferase